MNIPNSTLKSIGEFQRILTNIYTNTYCRKLFFKDKAAFIKELTLRDDERNLLSDLDENSVKEFSKSLARKRLDSIKKQHELLFLQFKKEMMVIFHQAYDLINNCPSLDSENYALRLGSVMLQNIQYSMLPPICYDLFLYKHLEGRALYNIDRKYRMITEPYHISYIPILHPGIKMAYFKYPIDQILNNNQALNNIESKPTCYIFYRENNKPAVLKIPAAVSNFLDLCWGGYTLEDIYSQLSKKLPENKLQQLKTKVVKNLLDEQIILLRKLEEE